MIMQNIGVFIPRKGRGIFIPRKGSSWVVVVVFFCMLIYFLFSDSALFMHHRIGGSVICHPQVSYDTGVI